MPWFLGGTLPRVRHGAKLFSPDSSLPPHLSHPIGFNGAAMRQNSPPADWFFPIEDAPVLVTVTHKGVARDVRVPHKKALVAADTGDIVGIVGVS